MKRLLSYLSDYKLQAVLAPLFKCLEACFELFVPVVISAMIDEGIGGGDRGMVMRMGLRLLLLAVIGLLCSISAQYFAAMCASHSGRSLRRDLFNHITTLGYSEIDALGTSTLITRMTSDINQIEHGVNMVLRLFMRSPFIVFGAVLMSFRISVRGSLIFLLTVPLLMLVVFGIMLITMPMYRRVQNRLDRVTKNTRENLLGVRVVRAFNRQEREMAEFKEENDLLTYFQVQVGKISALLNPVTYVIINLSVVALLYSGAGLVQQGAMTQGSVVALVNYMSQILVELIKLANLIILITRAYASLTRVDDIMAVNSPIELGNAGSRDAETEAEENTPFLAFRHMTFRYAGGQEAALHDIDLTIQKGQTIGVIGGTGSGKSSLVNLLPRFYDTSEGQILLEGQDIRALPVQTLRSRIGIVPQRSVLFSGTLRENLLWGRNDATEEELWEALRIAQAYDFVREKGDGLDLRIEQEGRNLSGGQRQRLCIARALVRRPDILILDDAASALDFATDANLRKAIREKTDRSTVFLVSQRVSTVRGADRILVLDEGEMVGFDTHEALLKTCTVYQEICQSQMSLEDAER